MVYKDYCVAGCRESCDFDGCSYDYYIVKYDGANVGEGQKLPIKGSSYIAVSSPVIDKEGYLHMVVQQYGDVVYYKINLEDMSDFYSVSLGDSDFSHQVYLMNEFASLLEEDDKPHIVY